MIDMIIDRGGWSHYPTGRCNPHLFVQPAGVSVRKSFLLLVAALIGAPFAPGQAAEPSFVPVLRTDFPDPFILPVDDHFLAYATNSAGTNVQVARSSDLVHWERVRDGGRAHDAMPVLPAWAREGWTWAPEVAHVGASYLLYFTARERSSGRQCIGVARASDPLGPFTSDAAEPLVCQRDLGGSIDASPFRDSDGRLFLYYKNDGNAVRRPVHLYAQPMAEDGLSVVGTPTAVLGVDSDWENGLVEAPTMVKAGARYFLFFSAGFFGWPATERFSPYAMGYASCDGPLGPCAPAAANPILHSFDTRDAGCLSGPGHQSVFEARGRWFLGFHAWAATSECRPADARRYLYVAPLDLSGPAPVIGMSLRPGASN